MTNDLRKELIHAIENIPDKDLPAVSKLLSDFLNSSGNKPDNLEGTGLGNIQTTILDFLKTQTNHVSVRQIHEHVRLGKPGIKIAVIYNSLNRLENRDFVSSRTQPATGKRGERSKTLYAMNGLKTSNPHPPQTAHHSSPRR